jgi:hypothetical protein
MTTLSLCDFCCGLIFWDENSFMNRCYYRGLVSLQLSASTHKCPFCQTFRKVIIEEHSDADGETCWKYDLETHHDGFILLTIFLCYPSTADQDPNEMKDYEWLNTTHKATEGGLSEKGRPLDDCIYRE